MAVLRIRGARTHNLRGIDLDLPRDRLIVIHRPVRLGQVFARVRHDLRRGPAPLRRVAVGLRAAVPVGDGKARRRPHRGTVAGDRDRAEGDLAQSALDGRHGHRDLRLPARAVRARRRARAVRSTARTSRRRRSARWSTRCCACRKALPCCCSPRSIDGPQGRAREVLEQLRSQGFVRAMDRRQV